MGKLKILAPRLGWREFMIGVGVLWLLSLAVGYVAQVSEVIGAEVWIVMGLRLVSYVLGMLLAFVVLFRMWGLAVRLGLFLWRLISDTEMIEIGGKLGVESPEEAPAAQEAVSGLERILEDLESDSGRAAALLVDAEQFAAALVRIARAISVRAANMRDEVEELQTALEAIESGERLAMARAAGKVRDGHIRELMLATVKAETYWEGVSGLIVAQLGTLERWAMGYERFAEQLIAEISQAKTRLASMEASLDLMGTARPLAQVQSKLNEAQGYLRMEMIEQRLKSLPVIETGMLE